MLQAGILTRLAPFTPGSSAVFLALAIVLAVLAARSWGRLAPSFLRDVAWVTA